MTKFEQKEHQRLLRRWRVGVATAAQMLRCQELDRKVAAAQRTEKL